MSPHGLTPPLPPLLHSHQIWRPTRHPRHNILARAAQNIQEGVFCPSLFLSHCWINWDCDIQLGQCPNYKYSQDPQHSTVYSMHCWHYFVYTHFTTKKHQKYFIHQKASCLTAPALQLLYDSLHTRGGCLMIWMPRLLWCAKIDPGPCWLDNPCRIDQRATGHFSKYI